MTRAIGHGQFSYSFNLHDQGIREKLGDKFAQQVEATPPNASCVLEHFCENLCFCSRILSPQQAAANQIQLVRLAAATTVAETNFHKDSPVHKGYCCNLSRNLSSRLYTRSDLFTRRVAGTCRLVCPDVYLTACCTAYLS